MLRAWRPRWSLAMRCKSIHRSPFRSIASDAARSRTSNPSPHRLHERIADYSYWTIYRVLLGGAVLHIFTTYFYTVGPAYGISMLPTFASFGEWVLISKYYRRGRDVHVGDVVSFKHPLREDETAVKRVIGLEGDFVLMNTPEKSDAMIQVPQGHCWVVGDNLKHSRDSRMFGPLPMALIYGKVIGKFNGTRKLEAFEWIQHGLQPYTDVDEDDDNDDDDDG